jgi:hypothetical protein
VYVVGRYDFVAFPAFPLLLGLAFAKVQVAVPSRRILAPLFSFFLLIPISAKLFLYYEAATPRPNEEIARTINTQANEDDVIIFTGLRKTSVMYYLIRLGFQWQNDSCVNEASHRRFSCPMFPRESEPYTPTHDPYPLLNSPNEARGDLIDIVGMRRSPDNSVWVVYGSFAHSRKLLRTESLLFNELKRAGFVRTSSHWPSGIVEFHQSAG